MEIKNLGQISGPIAVFGGVYSNFQALEEFKRQMVQLKISADRILCTGDMVGYCGSPNECLDAIQTWGIQSILGNVEENLKLGIDECGCNFGEGSRCDVFSRQWYAFASAKLKESQLDYLKTLPHRLEFTLGQKRVHVLHGSPHHISEFIFESTPWEQKQAYFDVLDVDIILAGHTGLPFFQERNGKIWINAGVIGMPANDGTSRVWFVTLDTVQDQIQCQFHTFEYDAGEANQIMLENGLSYQYADTLLSGLWDNNDILPPYETSQQGIMLPWDKDILIV